MFELKSETVKAITGNKTIIEINDCTNQIKNVVAIDDSKIVYLYQIDRVNKNWRFKPVDSFDHWDFTQWKHF